MFALVADLSLPRDIVHGKAEFAIDIIGQDPIPLSEPIPQLRLVFAEKLRVHGPSFRP